MFYFVTVKLVSKETNDANIIQSDNVGIRQVADQKITDVNDGAHLEISLLIQPPSSESVGSFLQTFK